MPFPISVNDNAVLPNCRPKIKIKKKPATTKGLGIGSNFSSCKSQVWMLFETEF